MSLLNRIFSRSPRQWFAGFDPILLASTALLCLLGVVAIYTSSSSLADRMYGSSLFFLRSHLLNLSVGLVAMVVAQSELFVARP